MTHDELVKLTSTAGIDLLDEPLERMPGSRGPLAEHDWFRPLGLGVGQHLVQRRAGVTAARQARAALGGHVPGQHGPGYRVSARRGTG